MHVYSHIQKYIDALGTDEPNFQTFTSLKLQWFIAQRIRSIFNKWLSYYGFTWSSNHNQRKLHLVKQNWSSRIKDRKWTYTTNFMLNRILNVNMQLLAYDLRATNDLADCSKS